MFKANPDLTFPFVAEITVPGQPTPAPLKLTGKCLTREAIDAWYAAAKDAEGKPVDDATWLDTILAGWEDVEGEGGAPLPYSVPALRALLSLYLTAADEIHRAYLTERTKSRAKN